MNEKVYECKHFELIRENEKFITVERIGNTVYCYIYDGKELRRYTIPQEDFIKLVIEGEI